jgi:hypothetical protein
MTLRAVFSLVAPLLGRAAAVMWAAEPARERYRDWLLVCHDLVRATTPLLSLALAESVRRGEDDLAAYFADQLTAESGHDVWLEQDWAAAGFDPVRLTHRVPSPAAARLAGAQYYWIQHAHPAGLLGHIAVLEWLPPRPGLALELMARTGWPAAAFRTLTEHTSLDDDHGQRLDELLSGLDLTRIHQRLVTTSAMSTAQSLVELMMQLGAGDGSVSSGAAGYAGAVGHR